MKQIALLVVVTAIHYSSLGNYLVDQDGKRTLIQGHPHMVCYEGREEVRGKFVSANGKVIRLRNYKGDFIIHKPVCDLK